MDMDFRDYFKAQINKLGDKVGYIYFVGENRLKRNHMKVRIFMFVMAFALVTLAVQFGATQIVGSHNRSGLLYTNLVDEGTQNEVKSILINAGINSTYVNDVFSWIDQYNAGIGGLKTFLLAPSFTQIDANYVWYGSDSEYPDVSRQWWKVNKYGYTDVLCRSAAYYLMRDYISVNNLVPVSKWHVSNDENKVSESWLVSDMDGITTNPYLSFSNDEVAQYFSLFNPIPLPEGTPERDMYTAIKGEWDARCVSFRKGSVSLVTIWMQSMNLAVTGHAAVLIEYEEGFLLFEKTNPEYPYQATKFDTVEEVKNYMISQLNSTFEDGAGTVIVLRNNSLL